MPGLDKKKRIPRRRRHDEGEDEGSVIDEFGVPSLSDGFASSDGDEEVGLGDSDSSNGAPSPVHETLAHEHQLPGIEPSGSVTKPSANASPKGRGGTRSKNDENLKLGVGLSADVDHNNAEEPHPAQGSTTKESNSLPYETPAQRNRREHLEYIKKRDTNPAFVPNRGGFFLHDDRGINQGAAPVRPFRERGRGRGSLIRSSNDNAQDLPPSGPAERQWAHDLHDTVNVVDSNITNKQPLASTTLAATSVPNRSFSSITILGNVPVQVDLPGSGTKRTLYNILKRQHTLLPEHRPPLRRDKPVRISIPDEQPRYVFPSTDRSFIFIPRALRPNQQAFTRGRGRGSFHASRRPSIYGGSTYTPSIGMSRKSSIGGTAPGSGVQTPTGMGVPHPFMGFAPRPVVRMPFPNTQGVVSMSPHMIHNNYAAVQYQIENGGIIHQSLSASLPMHQPRPQKTVSVADIETPGTKAPLQQQEEPFHQQMPPTLGYNPESVRQQGHTGAAPLPSLAHIPEGAVYAQPFQPFPLPPPVGYYGMPYAPDPYFYPPGNEASNFSMPMGGPVMAPVPDTQYLATQTSTPNPSAPQATVAHESNGMVFYFDPSHLPSNPNVLHYTPGNAGMPGVMPSGNYFYPQFRNGTYFSQQPGQ